MSRLLGVSKPCITAACRPGGRLHAAVVGTRVNALHESAQHWKAQRDAAAAPPEPSRPQTKKAAPLGNQGGEWPSAEPGPPVVIDEPPEEPARPKSELERELGELVDLASLREPLTTLTDRYGDAPALERWLRARKMLEEARKAEMLRERIAGRLVSRTTVQSMIGHVDTAFRVLLSDAPRTIAARLAPENTATAIALIRDVMSQALTAASQQMVTALMADDPMAPLLEAAAE